MTAIPFYNLVMIPGATYYFQGEYYKDVASQEAVKGEEVTFLMLRTEKDREDLQPEDFYPIGVYGVVESINRDGDVGIRAKNRVNLTNIRVEEGKILFDASPREDIEDMSQEDTERHLNEMKSSFMRFVSDQQWGVMARTYIMQWQSMAEILAAAGARLTITNEEKYEILASDSLSERTVLMERALYEFLEVTRVGSEAESAQVSSNEQMYREDAIRKQISFLERELEEMHPESVSDVRRFEQLIEEAGMNETAYKEARKVLGRMKQEGQNSNEYGLLYDYLDFVTGLVWKREEAEHIDLDRAAAILDEDHYGLKKVKNRVLQQIAVMDLNHSQSGSILLFVGAPGTGKTSIGQSIARALNRKYVRVSLGGVRDEAEIRGHRRTYIGAMPGRIMDGIKKCGVSNPVMVLDEVDKLTRDFAGDPSSALLEVLDPEQNSTFTDHYMNVPYDLSGVLFVCTANTLDTIPEPLLNRMEVIEFPGYTATEKFEIARKHLLPRAMKAAGIRPGILKVTDDALRAVIADYTMEAGVRGLKKRMDTICRSAAVRLVRGEQKTITVSPRRLQAFLDMKPLLHDRAMEHPVPGVVTGLAWTRAGGEILFVEAVMTRGQGKLLITGQLGDVMKESAQIAVSLVKSLYPEAAERFEKNDLHIHVPEGAVPKDGPSAGITMTTAIASLISGRCMDPATAMTGEVSLRGLVMPIGGLTEKLMAAMRSGLKRVLIPAENERDLDEVPAEVKDKLTIVPVRTVEEVLGMLTENPASGEAGQ